MSAITIPSFNDKRLDSDFARIFGASQFHSEACRQEAIGKTAKRIEKQIIAELMKNDSEAIEIGGDMIGFMEPETMARLIRFALRGDLNKLQLSLLAAMDESVKRTAELRAMRHVDEHGIK